MAMIQDFQSPVVNAQEPSFADEHANRVGILVGGMPELQWQGVGEMSVGHHIISRRIWLPFVRLQVGIRNEFDGALDLPENTVQVDWATSDARKKWKSPRACAQDVLNCFKEVGFCVPKVLIGHADPQMLAEKVWPREVRDNFRLFEHVAYFEGFQTNDEQEASLAADLLEATYISRNYIREYVRMLKTEINKELGLNDLNEPLKELFREINEPLPEQKTALVASAMGKEIVKATQSDGRKDEAMISVLGKIADRLDRLEQREPLTVPSGNTQQKEARDDEFQTSNTSTARRADGEIDRRFKSNKE